MSANLPKFTPGPWMSDSCAVFQENAPVDEEKVNVAVCHPQMPLSRLEYEIRRANARLISAAPEMYEALQRIIEAQDYSIRYATDAMRDQFEPEWCKLARAALAKAEGHA